MKKGPAAPITCPFTSCDVNPLLCDGYAPGAIARRDVRDIAHDGEDFAALDERDNTRSFIWTLLSGAQITMRSLGYPGPTEYMRMLTAGVRNMIGQWLALPREQCSEVEMVERPLQPNTSPPAQAQVEHAIPVRTGRSYCPKYL